MNIPGMAAAIEKYLTKNGIATIADFDGNRGILVLVEKEDELERSEELFGKMNGCLDIECPVTFVLA